jgi:hypothetical protein
MGRLRFAAALVMSTGLLTALAAPSRADDWDLN